MLSQADVKTLILSADFQSNFEISLNMANQMLTDNVTKLAVQESQSPYISTGIVFVLPENETYQKLLKKISGYRNSFDKSQSDILS